MLQLKIGFKKKVLGGSTSHLAFDQWDELITFWAREMSVSLACAEGARGKQQKNREGEAGGRNGGL